MHICDTHCDTLYALSIEKKTDPDVTADKLTIGGVTLQCMALWTGRDGLKGDYEGIVAKELQALEFLKTQGFVQVDDPAEAKEGQLSIMLTVEGGEVFQKGLETIPYWREKGVRMAALTWNNENRIGFPAKGGPKPGLTEYGVAAVKEMQKHGIAVDVSHLNEQGFYDIFAKTDLPPLASHSCCRALCDHSRNLTDHQIKLMIQSGGYIGMNFYPYFLTGSDRCTLEDVVHHIDYICQMGGAKNVGFGSDFDGIECTPADLRDPRDLPALMNALKKRGYTDADIEAIAGRNLMDYFARIN